MKSQLLLLRECLQEWLQIHDLDYDFWIFEPTGWRARKGKYLVGAHMVFVFDSEVTERLIYDPMMRLEDELQDLAEGFGYYFEYGTHYQIGFYPTDDFKALPAASASYSRKLRDPRWRAKATKIRDRAKHRCESCGKTRISLEVHHCYYRQDRMPWQYPDRALLCLCEDCHEVRHVLEIKWRGFLPLLTTKELESARKFLARKKHERRDKAPPTPEGNRTRQK